MLSYRQLVEQAKQKVKQVTASDVRERMAQNEPLVLIDTREQNEWNLGHIPHARHIGRGVLEQKIESQVPHDATVVLYCASGNRSALAAEQLLAMGYTDVASMAGGIKDWVATGGEIED